MGPGQRVAHPPNERSFSSPNRAGTRKRPGLNQRGANVVRPGLGANVGSLSARAGLWYVPRGPSFWNRQVQVDAPRPGGDGSKKPRPLVGPRPACQLVSTPPSGPRHSAKRAGAPEDPSPLQGTHPPPKKGGPTTMRRAGCRPSTVCASARRPIFFGKVEGRGSGTQRAGGLLG
jgi:hypothetical protein